MNYDYSTIEAFQARARRERAEAAHELLIAPLARLVKRAVAPECAPQRIKYALLSPGSAHVQGRPSQG